MRTYRITIQHILKGLLLMTLGAGIVWYSLFQARNLILGPEIVINSPESTIQNERTIQVEGSTKNITALTLNGKQIFTDENGIFRNMLVLEDGYTIMTVRANDKYGRSVSLSKTFVYTPTNDIN